MTIEFSTIEKNVSHNIEAQYQYAVERIVQLAFFLEWALHLQNAKDARPTAHLFVTTAEPSVRFHDIEAMPANELETRNDTFSKWVIHRILRDQTEFFSFYLLELFQTCTIIAQADKSIRPKDIVEGLKAGKMFDGASLKQRLSTLRQRFQLVTPYGEELICLNKLRNVMAHYDGVVSAKNCDKSGRLKIKWPGNTYRLLRRDTGKYVNYADVPKPFKGDDYAQIETVFLNKQRVTMYHANDRIELSPAQLEELNLFYLHVLNEFQKELIEFARAHGVRVRPLSEYMPKGHVIAVVEK